MASRWGLLSLARDSRVIAATLGVASIGLVAGIRIVLEYIRDQNEVKAPQMKPQYITQETEDSLKLNTLESLLGHYNYAIRENAAKIICDRAVNDPEAVNYLLWGITRPDYEERMKSLRALALIIDPSKPESLQVLHSTKGYSALVRSLELCALEAPYEKMDKDWDDYPLRDMSEKFCLMFVLQLLKRYDSDRLLRTKFVERWVARQAWGDTDEERQFTFARYLAHRNNRITEICLKINDTRRGREALERVGLLRPGSSWDGNDENDNDNQDQDGRFSIVLSINMPGGEGGEEVDSAQIVDALSEALQPRMVEQSAAEQRIRRQHREAMVLNDGTRPLGRGDIIERDHHD